VRLLVEHGADVRVQNDGGWTPLAEAAVRGYFDIAQLLLEHGADVHVQNKGGWTPVPT
jgi:ankyrin repeat protein